MAENRSLKNEKNYIIYEKLRSAYKTMISLC